MHTVKLAGSQQGEIQCSQSTSFKANYKTQYLLGDIVKNPDTLDLFLARPNIHRKLLQSD